MKDMEKKNQLPTWCRLSRGWGFLVLLLRTPPFHSEYEQRHTESQRKQVPRFCSPASRWMSLTKLGPVSLVY